MADEVQVDLDKVEELLKKASGEDAAPEVIEERKPADIQKGNEDSVDELRKRLEEANNRAAQATQRASEAEGAAHRARTTVHQTQVEMITDTIDATTREKDLVKTRLIEAQAAGDHALAADLQEQFITMTTDIANLKAKKIDVETRPPPAEPQTTQRTDPVEGLAHFMDTNGAPRAAAWVRAHPEFARDPKKYAAMLAAHNVATNIEGLEAETDEYFAHVEKTLKLQPAAGREGAESTASQATGGRQVGAAPPAAPPSRSGNGSSSTRTGRVTTLTREEAEIAVLNKQTPEEYYAEKQALIREGKMIGKPH